MPTNTDPRVVVGIDDTAASATGVRYAALEAQRLGAELDIIHAAPAYSDVHGDLPILNDQMLAIHGQKLLDAAERVAHSEASDVSVRTHLVSGGAVWTLVSATHGATLLVLGAERRSFVGRLWTGDIVGGVAARAHCPVVVVAPEWVPSEGHGRIVVGLKSMDNAAELLDAGLALAHAIQAELVVVHAWKLRSGYDDLVGNRADSEDYGRRMTSLVEPVVNDLRQAYHDVAVRIEVLHAQPALALVNASAGADRILLARPPRVGIPHHLGHVARAVLHEARCPVEIIPLQQHEANRQVSA